MKESLFLEGYLDKMFKKGKRPAYGYPANSGLPKVPPGFAMKVKTALKLD